MQNESRINQLNFANDLLDLAEKCEQIGSEMKIKRTGGKKPEILFSTARMLADWSKDAEKGDL